MKKKAMRPEDLIKKLNDKNCEIQRLVDRVLPIKIGNTAVSHFKENFIKGGFVNDGLQRWKPAKRLNSKYGSKQPTLLSERNHLYSSINRRTVPGGVEIYNDVPYAKAHNEGTSSAGRNRNVTIPKRQFIGESKELRDKINTLVKKELNNILK